MYLTSLSVFTCVWHSSMNFCLLSASASLSHSSLSLSLSDLSFLFSSRFSTKVLKSLNNRKSGGNWAYWIWYGQNFGRAWSWRSHAWPKRLHGMVKSFCNQITNCPTTQNATVTYLDSLHSLQNRAQSPQSTSWVPGLLQNCRVFDQWNRAVVYSDSLCIRIRNTGPQKPVRSFRGVVLGDLVYSFEHSSRCMQIREPWVGSGKLY